MAPIILRAVYIKHTYIRKKYVFCFLGKHTQTVNKQNQNKLVADINLIHDKD